ncbi:hypothetical protein C5B41_16810 [Acinetobacter ursingii]|nr:hypothetical protein C5B41_16810 [Acinetobacter ursingii]
MSVDFCDARQGGGAYGKTPATRPFYGSWPFAGLLLTCWSPACKLKPSSVPKPSQARFSV